MFAETRRSILVPTTAMVSTDVRIKMKWTEEIKFNVLSVSVMWDTLYLVAAHLWKAIDESAMKLALHVLTDHGDPMSAPVAIFARKE